MSKGNISCIIGWIQFLLKSERFIFIDSCVSDDFSNSFSRPHVKTKQHFRSCGKVVIEDLVSVKLFTKNNEDDQAELVYKFGDKYDFEHDQLTITVPRLKNQIKYWVLVIDGSQN